MGGWDKIGFQKKSVQELVRKYLRSEKSPFAKGDLGGFPHGHRTKSPLSPLYKRGENSWEIISKSDFFA
jgi:hypothetical protein